jgi:hypothetical protein
MNDMKMTGAPQPECSESSTSHGPGKPWEVEVDVYLQSVGPPAQFELKTCLPVNANDEIVFANKRRPGFNINFNLYDDTNGGGGSGYVFPNPPKLPHQAHKWALWSKEGHGCPPANFGQQWPEFESISVKNQGKTLVVRNLNQNTTRFGFTLRVTNDNGGTFVDLDPGGDNKNGPPA